MERNELYPLFVKVDQLNVLIVGAGNTGLEKLSFLLKSSPNAHVEVIANDFKDEVVALAAQHATVTLTKKAFEKEDLANRHLVIGATAHHESNVLIHGEAKKRNLLVNIADTPAMCDFYLGGIVTKGHVKIAISTNGKSPTTAKRIRQFLEEVIPEDINELVENLNKYRKSLTGDFAHKVQMINEATKGLINKKD